MSHQRDVQRLAEAIRDAERCPLFAEGEIESCEGLEGCEDCLELAAKAGLPAVGDTR